MKITRLIVTFVAGLFAMTAASFAAANANGSGGDMPAYYDATLFMINFKAQPGTATAALQAHNGSINTIYMCDSCEAAGLMFIAVLDAIQGDGFNPLWVEMQIAFTPGHAPQQFTSDNDVLKAWHDGVITLTPTGELYRCAVVGPKK